MSASAATDSLAASRDGVGAIAPGDVDPEALRGSLARAAQMTRMYLGFFLAGFVVVWLLCAALVVHLRYHRAAARRGDEAAVRKIILPAFEPLLVMLGVFNSFFIVFLALAMGNGTYSAFVPPVVLETLYSAHQFDFLTVLVFMFQPSVSLPALRRTLAISLALSGYTIPYVGYVMKYGDPDKQSTYVAWLHPLRALVLVLSLYVLVRPPNRASRRTLRELALYSIVRYCITLAHMVMVMTPSTREDSKYVLLATLFLVALNPLVIWRVLKADTGFWRGMGDRACALQGLFKQSHHVHEGVSSQGLHVLIELHRKHIIDFAHLEVRQQIGVGTTSTVFRGTLRAKLRVAVKLYQPASLTEDVVAGFSQEAALCGLLRHPNIVAFFGMCVSPPAICLVFELCQGSLHDVLRVHARQPFEPARQQLLISVGYLLDAARAVAYLHSFSPPFVHRDIKPSNLLVDAACRVKLSDFGESRALGAFGDADASRERTSSAARHSKSKSIAAALRRPSATAALDDGYEASSPGPVRDEQPSASAMTVKGTAEYMAPEVINGRAGVACYDQAADVYSLAITMFDVLHPGAERFRHANSHLRVFERVLGGARPALDPALPRRLRDVIARAWAGDPRARPSAREVVAALEEVQEALSVGLVVDVLDDLQLCVSAADGESASTCASADAGSGVRVTGAAVAEALVARRFVASEPEAARMGAAWMDAGLLHHARHARAFESSATELYYFDVDANAALRLAWGAVRHSDPTSSIPMLSRSNHQRRRASSSRTSSASVAVPIDGCACQRLARGGAGGKAWGRFRRQAPGARRATPSDDMVLTTALLMDSDDDALASFSMPARASHA